VFAEAPAYDDVLARPAGLHRDQLQFVGQEACERLLVATTAARRQLSINASTS
jgi:hypothetical protein